MKIWFTDQGRATIRELTAICKREDYKAVVVVGRSQIRPLLDSLRRGCGQSVQITELDNIDDLAEIQTVNDNRLFIVHSLVSQYVKDPVDYLRLYCRQRKLKLLFAPVSMRRSDIECLYQHELDSGFDRLCHGNRWALDIAHETALSLSAGILNCYYAIRDVFVRAYQNNPEELPSAQQCMEDYQRGQELDGEAAFVKQRLRGNGGLERLLNTPDDDDWLVLWSIGLAGRFNGQWQFSPFLLDSPKLYREQQHRLQRAINITLVPIYQAWVFYCEKKYNLRELETDNRLIAWYPKSVLYAVQQCDAANPDDLDMCRDVRALRNWVQHDEGEDQNCYLRDYRQTRYNVLRTCATIIKTLDPDGNLK